MRKYFISLALVLALPACRQQPMQSGIDTAAMDTSARPQAGLYEYMNGHWLKTFEIPADKSGYGTFTKLYDDTEQNLRSIIEDAAHQPSKKPGSDAQKVGDFYVSFMDSARCEALGITPIKEDLAAVQNLKTKSDVITLAATLTRVGVANPFVEAIDQDEKQSTQYILYLFQSGLSLPDRDYYLRDDQKFADIRSRFLAHVEKMLTMAGYQNATTMARQVMNLEMMIAKSHWTQVENRDRIKTYNKFALADLQRLTPSFDWQLYTSAAGMKSVDSVVVAQPSYFKALDSTIASVPLEDWKSYYIWRVLARWAPYVSSGFVAEQFDFFGRTLQGIQEDRPRWKRGVSAVNNAMGELVGRIYVEKYFKSEAKERMVRLVNNLKESFRERISALSWMGDETKQKALAKLAKFGTKIGYPDKWKDYSALEVKPDDLVGNLKRSSRVEYDREANKLGKPIDRAEWGMTPQTVNAYYNPRMNEIVFPAAILQPPFFTMEADDAVNYGAIGAVIGHEMTHGFDDQGRKSDGDGNLTEWWTEKDGKEFEQRARVMVEQYNGYRPIDTISINGELTLGENIADLGGMTIAYYAYRRALGGKEAPVIDGFTSDQRFFLGWAQVWAGKFRDAEMRRRLVIDPHSPGRYRVDGIVANMPEFYKAFGVKEGDPLYRPAATRVEIW